MKTFSEEKSLSSLTIVFLSLIKNKNSMFLEDIISNLEKEEGGLGR